MGIKLAIIAVCAVVERLMRGLDHERGLKALPPPPAVKGDA